MKSVAIFLTLVFLTGFQAAVLSEEPPPPIPEPNQTVLEQLQEQLGKVSNQVTNSVNGGLDMIKGRASDLMAYTTDLGKKYNSQKLMTRKFSFFYKDLNAMVQGGLNQSKEAIKVQYNKAMEAVEEMKKHPTMVALHEEMVEPFLKKCQSLASWISDQSIASMTNMVQKKLNL